MRWSDVSQVFETDGALRDVIVQQTSVADWDILIRLAMQLGSVSYQSDGTEADLPTSAAELLDDKSRAHCMKIDLGGPVAIAHFFTSKEIELDHDPREITSQSTLDHVLTFYSKLGNALQRDIAITDESDAKAKLLSYSVRNRTWALAGDQGSPPS